MPSGHVPAYAIQHPEELGGVDCRIAIPKEAVDQLRKFLEEDSNKTCTECFQWFTWQMRHMNQLENQFSH